MISGYQKKPLPSKIDCQFLLTIIFFSLSLSIIASFTTFFSLLCERNIFLSLTHSFLRLFLVPHSHPTKTISNHPFFIQALEKKNAAAANATEATNDTEDVNGTEENSENITENDNNDEDAPADDECNDNGQDIDENDQTEIEAAS